MDQRKWIDFFINSDKPEPKYDASLFAETIFDSLDLTHLSESQIKLLMEGRLENVQKKYGIGTENELISAEALDMIQVFDEQYKYKHLAWAARQLVKLDGDLEQEEVAEELVGTLTDFVRYTKPAPFRLKKKDINQYKSINELIAAIHSDVMQPRIDKARKDRRNRPGSQEMLDSGQASVVYEDERFFVVRPSDTEASCHFGSKTQWCISQEGNTYYSSYTEQEGKVFYFLKDDERKNEDDFYKIAMQMTAEDDNIEYETFWDRYDESYDSQTSDAMEFAQHLSDEMGIPLEKAEAIMEAVEEHLLDNLPESPLADMDKRIYDGEWNSGFLSVNSEMDDYGEGSYLQVNANAYITWEIKSAILINKIDAGEFDLDDLADRVQEEFTQNMFDRETVAAQILSDAGVTDYYIDNGNYSQGIEVSGDTQAYALNFDITLYDEDTGTAYNRGTLAELEPWLNTLKHEWGEENKEEIITALNDNLYKLFPEAVEDVSGFKALKGEFTDGTHEMIPGKTFYTIHDKPADDEEDDGMAEIVLHAAFTFSLPQEVISQYYPMEEFISAATGKPALRLKGMWERPPPPKIGAIGSMGLAGAAADLKQIVATVITTVYEQAMAEANKQLPLDFGDGKVYVAPGALPATLHLEDFDLTGLNYVAIWGASKSMPPERLELQLGVRIPIPFMKAMADMSRLAAIFKVINDNYSAIEEALKSRLSKYMYPGGKPAPTDATPPAPTTQDEPHVSAMADYDRALAARGYEPNPNNPNIQESFHKTEEVMTSACWLLKEVEKMFDI